MSEKSAEVFIRQLDMVSSCGDSVKESFAHLEGSHSHVVDVWHEDQLLGQGYGYSPAFQQQLTEMLASKHWRHTDAMVRALYLVARRLDTSSLLAEDMGLIVGSSRGPCGELESTLSKFYLGVPFALKAKTSPSTTFAAITSFLAQSLRLGGYQLAVSAACISSHHSIGLAYRLVKGGSVRHCLAGGAEDPLTAYVYSLLKAAKVLAKTSGQEVPLPAFGLRRSGMVPGQGAGLALLSSQGGEGAGTILGFGSTTEQAGLVGVSPCAAGLQKAFRQALSEAQITPSQIDIIAVHGAGTQLGDREEMRAIKQLFQGPELPRLLITPWATGHTLGASGVMKLGFLLEALRVQKVPPPPYPLDPMMEDFMVPLTKEASIGCLLGLGFGGVAAVMIVKKGL